MEHMILKVGQNAVETARASFLYPEHLDSTQDDLYDPHALPSLVQIISSLSNMDMAYMQSQL